MLFDARYCFFNCIILQLTNVRRNLLSLYLHLYLHNLCIILCIIVFYDCIVTYNSNDNNNVT